jgi:hypothetical protein
MKRNPVYYRKRTCCVFRESTATPISTGISAYEFTVNASLPSVVLMSVVSETSGALCPTDVLVETPCMQTRAPAALVRVDFSGHQRRRSRACIVGAAQSVQRNIIAPDGDERRYGRRENSRVRHQQGRYY